MNKIYLFQVWQRDSRVGSSKGVYRLHFVTENIEEAKEICNGSNGEYVYSYLETFYGENG
jgi:hypothetical protein